MIFEEIFDKFRERSSVLKKFLPQNFIRLTEIVPFPLFVVGGSVRDFLCGALKGDADWDIAGAGTDEELVSAANEAGFTVDAVYKNTGTVRLTDPEGQKYEFTRFRSDKYVRGLHAPAEIEFTADIQKDALRRDFTANAVYYDAVTETFADPLGGIPDIKKRIFRTVAPSEKVFGEDGLRLMRLARLAAETGFTPDTECLAGAKKHASLIRDIVPERIFAELKRLLETESGESAYRGLHILKETGVLREILPELALGDGLLQRADFHKYDVLEHSFRCVRYAERDIRFAALLHDVGKPFCFYRDGNFYLHPDEGARISAEILTRLKAPKKLVAETERLVALHMRDVNHMMKEFKIRKTIAENYRLLPKLLALFQADFTACKDDLSPAPTAVKWRTVCDKMEREGAPRSLKELKINGNDLTALGVKPEKMGEVLSELLLFAIEDGARNNRETLENRVKKLHLR